MMQTAYAQYLAPIDPIPFSFLGAMVLTEYNPRDAELLNPRKIEIVPNGIPDPCPDFEEAILPVRRKRMGEGYPEESGWGETGLLLLFTSPFPCEASRRFDRCLVAGNTARGRGDRGFFPSGPHSQ
jgi:hypothetical protein